MREILFRGIAKSHGTFEFGDLITSMGKTYIGNTIGNHPDNWCEVIPETVGQFTGLTDKNGVKIFEGDVVGSKFWNPKNYKVVFQDGEFCFTTDNLQPYTNSIHYLKDFEVIGNIHDNPEML